MSDAIRLTYTVTVEVDPDVWMLNYGTEPSKVNEDINDTMTEVIREAVNGWFIRTGNTGYARVPQR